ncbi:replication initiation protein [Clostridium botulinum C]|uniref:replication initiation protein n=1 Tax=Clostridium botulinum TaxID=1491 RepID=UPI001E53F668|nr:replication initiation protein [Clostridium botulinum]MCD3217241.1 replication initiation protein [Clostridium botulinum C]
MKSRQVVMTSYEVTTVENRFFYYILYKAQKEKNGIYSCIINIDEFKNLTSNPNQKTIAAIKIALNKLKSTILIFDKEDIECNYSLIGGYEFNRATGEFSVKLLPVLYEYLIKYTVYAPLNLQVVSRFKSFYTQRLYELMRLWSRTNEYIIKEFKIEDLRFVLATENKYPKYKNFNQRVLSPAVKELNETGNMEIVTTEIKSGRKVAKIQFKILDREPKKYFKNLEAINSPIEISDVLLKDEIKPKDIVETSLTKKIGIENVLHIENKAGDRKSIKERK